jgi:2-amino-4-hydroxy-6-hydroxymethyldihydropteridine diphosphokinase
VVQAANEMSHRAWLGLGSNLGNGRNQLEQALGLLKQHPSVEVVRCSSLYRSSPWGVLDQADFSNAVAELKVQIGADQLLQLFQNIERQMGRDYTGRRWGPRKIDLDLLLFDEKIFHWADLIVPHPRMHKRVFVLLPLFELEPELKIPSRGTVRSCLARLKGKNEFEADHGPSGIEKLSEEIRI